MNKKAILLVSFGTSFAKTREKTIYALESAVASAFPDYAFYRAWTSVFIRRKLEREENLIIPGLEESFKQMMADGIQEVYIQPTHMINGHEYDKIISAVKSFSDDFSLIKAGKPLLSSDQDILKTLNIIHDNIHPHKDEFIVMMGHGTDHSADHIYQHINKLIKSEKISDMYMGTVEGQSDLNAVIAHLKCTNYKKLILTPFMIVAGDHAHNDLAGDDDSWKNILINHGFDVSCLLRGLGEYTEIHKLLIDHLSDIL